MALELLRWWLVVELLGVLALPLTIWFFRGLPDRGYSLAKPLGILLVGYGGWLLSMLGLGALGPLQLGTVALVVAGGGAWLLGRDWRAQLRTVLRAQRGWIVLQEALFVAALAVGLWLRWHQFWGFGAGIQTTEQPMDLTLLSGILQSPQFPPQDPWFAPYAINYYYLGYLLLASLMRLSGVGVGVGYTLSLATLYALTATGVAGLVRNLIDLTLASETSAPDAAETSEPRRGLGRWIFPVLGAILVLICTNQVGALAVLAGSEKVVALNAGQLAQAVGNGLGAKATLELPPPFPTNDFGDNRIDPTRPLGDTALAWWASRAVWDSLPTPDGTVERRYNITEFPFFSFLLGDLHPHVQALPWALLAIGLALEVVTRRRAPGLRSAGDFVRLAVTGIVLGGLYAINSWDLPTYLLLYIGALALLYARLASSIRTFFWAHFVQQVGAVVIAAYMLYIPFHMTFVAPTEGFPLALSRARTSLTAFAIMFGLFFVPLLAWMLGRVSQLWPTEGEQPRRPLGAIGLVLFGALLALGTAVGWPLIGLFPLALAAVYLALRSREQPATAFALWVFALAACVIWGVDLVYLRDIYGTRMNTIFKFYYQVWLIWGMLAAYALWFLSRRLTWRSAVWLAPTALLFVGALVYPLRAPGDAPSLTLDGLAYLRRDAPDEAAAGDWIMRNTPGDAVVLQAPGIPYRSNTARIASVTGRPTVIGWTQHESLWRGGQPELRDMVGSREQDVKLLYTTTDASLAQSLLARYGVDYVVVGPNEQTLANDANAPAEALTKFGGWMPVAFQQGAFTIYGQP